MQQDTEIDTKWDEQEPAALRVPNAVRFSGIGRSKLYELMAAGEIEARKCGASTLVITRSLKAYLARLPSAYPRSSKVK